MSKDLSVEELLKIASKEGRSNFNLVDDKSNVKEFLREYGIKDGPALVPTYVIYYHYAKVWQPRSQRKLSKIAFFRKFNVVFRSKRSNSTRYYYLNEGVFDLSKEANEEAKQFDKRYRRKIAKKREQKKQDKVSRPATKVQLKNATGLHRAGVCEWDI